MDGFDVHTGYLRVKEIHRHYLQIRQSTSEICSSNKTCDATACECTTGFVLQTCKQKKVDM